jgi:aspartate aminotransferase
MTRPLVPKYINALFFGICNEGVFVAVDPIFSSRVTKVKPSPTMAVTARAAALRAAGEDVIGLGAGEPDFDTPEHVKLAAKQAIDAGFTKYTAVGGTVELKQAIATKFSHDNGLGYELDQILVSAGGKQSFYNLVQALIDDGDEVVIPAPYWVSYPDIVLLAGGRPVFVAADISSGFKITPEQLDDALTPKTRLAVINSPSNPTGAVYSHAELTALGEVLGRYPQAWIVSDDIYEKVYWDGEPFANIATLCPDLADRTLVLNGVSKAYAMTGWRIGYAAGDRRVIAQMSKVQSQSTSNPCSISQAAALAALAGNQDCIVPMVDAFKQRHDFVLDALNNLPGFECITSTGAFYAFPRVEQAMTRLPGISNDVEFAEYLIEKAKVALVPGSAFGAPGHLRLSFATSLENLREATKRIADVMASEAKVA